MSNFIGNWHVARRFLHDSHWFRRFYCTLWTNMLFVYTRFKRHGCLNVYRVSSWLSDSFIGLSGIPQGCVLSPLLFLLYVNDCTSILARDGCLLYADCVKIFLPVPSSTDCGNLQTVLNSFSVLCNNNGLHLCLNRCCFISFIRSALILFSYSLCDTVIRRVSSVMDLGVCLDEKLSFNTHVVSHDCLIQLMSSTRPISHRDSL